MHAILVRTSVRHQVGYIIRIYNQNDKIIERILTHIGKRAYTRKNACIRAFRKKYPDTTLMPLLYNIEE